MILTTLANRTRLEEPTRAKPEASPTPQRRDWSSCPPAPAPVRPAPVPVPMPPPDGSPRPPPRRSAHPDGPASAGGPASDACNRRRHPTSSRTGSASGTRAGPTRQPVFSPRPGGTDAARRANGRPGAPSPRCRAPPQSASERPPGLEPARRRAGTGPPARRTTRSIAARPSARLRSARLSRPGARRGEGGRRAQQMGPLFFDPEGADFTAWINHCKNEVYRNWIVPQPALFGFRAATSTSSSPSSATGA